MLRVVQGCQRSPQDHRILAQWRHRVRHRDVWNHRQYPCAIRSAQSRNESQFPQVTHGIGYGRLHGDRVLRDRFVHLWSIYEEGALLVQIDLFPPNPPG